MRRAVAGFLFGLGIGAVTVAAGWALRVMLDVIGTIYGRL